MKTSVAVVVTSLAMAIAAVTGCTVTNQATDKICQPNQRSHCNDCPAPKAKTDTRVYVGWNTCADDGKSYIGTCSECAPEHPMATSASGAGAGSTDGVGTVDGTDGKAALRPAPDNVSNVSDVASPSPSATSTADPSSPDVALPTASDNTSLPTDDTPTATTCHSTTLNRDVPESACAWSKVATDWEQCHNGIWYLGIFSDDTGTYGPTGVCSEIDDLL